MASASPYSTTTQQSITDYTLQNKYPRHCSESHLQYEVEKKVKKNRPTQHTSKKFWILGRSGPVEPEVHPTTNKAQQRARNCERAIRSSFFVGPFSSRSSSMRRSSSLRPCSWCVDSTSWIMLLVNIFKPEVDCELKISRPSNHFYLQWIRLLSAMSELSGGPPEIITPRSLMDFFVKSQVCLDKFSDILSKTG